MLHLVVGGISCGKSDFAQNLAINLYKASENTKLFYIATLRDTAGGDTQCRIQRHKKNRESLPFITLECADKDIRQVEELHNQNNCVVLLEDLGNMVFNALYLPPTFTYKRCVRRVYFYLVRQLFFLVKHTQHTVIVVNNVAEGGGVFFERNTSIDVYIKLMGKLAQTLAHYAATVTEVHCGIPICIKGSI